MNRKFNRIKSFEESFFKSSEDNPKGIFRNINKDQWIADVSWPFDAYKILSELPLGNVLPGHVKLWINNLRILLGNKNLNKRGYKNLTGYLLLFLFAKKKKLNIHAEAFFFKRNSKYVVLFYPKTKSVIKVILSTKTHHLKQLKSEFSQEIEAQKLANEIIHPTVSSPKLISYNLNHTTPFLEQELISNGKSLKYLTLSKTEKIIATVFDFMFEFYKKNTFILKSLDVQKWDEEKILNVFELYHLDSKLIKRFNTLLSQQKKLIYGRIHGDLHLDNILQRKEKTFILDWGRSQDSFFAEETLNDFIYFPEELMNSVYSRLLIYFDFDSKDLYSLKEQQFLMVCCQIFDRIQAEEQLENDFLSSFLNTKFKILNGNNLI